MRVRRTATSANSAATKKAFARTSRRTTSKRPVTAPAPRCDVTCCIAAESAMSNQSIRNVRDLTETQPPSDVNAIALESQLIIEPADLVESTVPSHFRTLRWVYLARLILATAIFFAAVSVWLRAEGVDTLVASLAFIGAL